MFTADYVTRCELYRQKQKMSDKAVKKCFNVILIMIKIKSPSRFLSLNEIKKDIDFHYSAF